MRNVDDASSRNAARHDASMHHAGSAKPESQWQQAETGKHECQQQGIDYAGCNFGECGLLGGGYPACSMQDVTETGSRTLKRGNAECRNTVC